MTAEFPLKSILVVDDDSIFHFLMKKTLTRLGIVPEAMQFTLNGKEALDIFMQALQSANQLPEIIFLDLNMPILNGFDFLEELKKLTFNREHVRIVITSSSFSNRDIEHAISLGANQYLSKPVTDDDLRKILK